VCHCCVRADDLTLGFYLQLLLFDGISYPILFRSPSQPASLLAAAGMCFEPSWRRSDLLLMRKRVACTQCLCPGGWKCGLWRNSTLLPSYFVFQKRSKVVPLLLQHACCVGMTPVQPLPSTAGCHGGRQARPKPRSASAAGKDTQKTNP